LEDGGHGLSWRSPGQTKKNHEKHESGNVGFQVLTAASMKMSVPSSKYFWNVGRLLTDYTALQPRRQPSSWVRSTS
jgi:hypothetical protein